MRSARIYRQFIGIVHHTLTTGNIINYEEYTKYNLQTYWETGKQSCQTSKRYTLLIKSCSSHRRQCSPPPTPPPHPPPPQAHVNGGYFLNNSCEILRCTHCATLTLVWDLDEHMLRQYSVACSSASQYVEKLRWSLERSKTTFYGKWQNKVISCLHIYQYQ